MNVYMTEEEQVEAIKKWWSKYGNHLMTLILCVLAGVALMRWYDKHQYSVKSQASQGFERVMNHYAVGNKQGVEAEANYLISKYKGTVYADGAQLLLSKEAIESGQYAKAQERLKWVLSHSKVKVLKQIARLRLARLLSMDKKYQQALAVLKVVDDNSFITSIYEVKGDVYFALGKSQEAKAQYALAIKHLPNRALASKELNMKLNQVSMFKSKVVNQEAQKATKMS